MVDLTAPSLPDPRLLGPMAPSVVPSGQIVSDIDNAVQGLPQPHQAALIGAHGILGLRPPQTAAALAQAAPASPVAPPLPSLGPGAPTLPTPSPGTEPEPVGSDRMASDGMPLIDRKSGV